MSLKRTLVSSRPIEWQSAHHSKKFFVQVEIGFTLLYVGYKLLCTVYLEFGGITLLKCCCRSVGKDFERRVSR